MFKKKKKKQEGFEEIESLFGQEKKKKQDTPVRIKEEDHYAVLEPLDLWAEKETSIEEKPIVSKEVMEITGKKSKEVKPKQVEEKKPKEPPKVEKKEIEKGEEKPKIEFRKLEKKEEEVKPKEVKPKLIIKKTISKEDTPETPVQKVLLNPPEKITKPGPAREIPLNHIETDIDKLLQIIDEKKVVGLEYLSKKLKINVNRLETWAKILEDRGLIEIEYPIIGLPRLRKKEWKKKS